MSSSGRSPGSQTPPISPAMNTMVVVKMLRASAANIGPMISATRGAGLDCRRSKKPPSRSRATVMPELMPANPAPIVAAMGIVKARYEAPANSGSAPMPWNAPDVAIRMKSGMMSDGMNTDGTRRTNSRLRPASPRLTARPFIMRPPVVVGEAQGQRHRR